MALSQVSMFISTIGVNQPAGEPLTAVLRLKPQGNITGLPFTTLLLLKEAALVTERRVSRSFSTLRMFKRQAILQRTR